MKFTFGIASPRSSVGLERDIEDSRTMQGLGCAIYGLGLRVPASSREREVLDCMVEVIGFWKWVGMGGLGFGAHCFFLGIQPILHWGVSPQGYKPV